MSDIKKEDYKIFLHIFPGIDRESGFNCCMQIDTVEEGKDRLERMFEAILERFNEEKEKMKECHVQNSQYAPKEFQEEQIIGMLASVSRLIKNYKNSVGNLISGTPTEIAIDELKKAIIHRGRDFKMCVSSDTL